MISYDLYSFDIFDTIITRKVAKPNGIFALMQNVINSNSDYADLPQDVKTNFFKYRTNAEYRQRRLNVLWKEDKEITFEQIYKDIQETYFLSDVQIEKLKELELNLEYENIIPINENIQKINNLINNGKRVVLISDMYLSEEVIRKFLAKTGLINGIKIYVSSDAGYKKGTGEIYKYVKSQENVEFENWYHLGDNEYSDYKQALYLGINSELYHYTKLKCYEEKLLRLNYESPAVQLTIKKEKNLRLANYKISDKFDLGVSLAAPIFYPYVEWLLKQAQKRNIKYLYFLARDGYILQKIADIIIKDRNLNIKTEYVYGSRKAWRLPSLSLENKMLKKQFVETLMWEYKNLDKVLGLTNKELTVLLPDEFRNYNSTMSDKKLKKFKDFLLKDDNWLKPVIEKNKDKKYAAVQYLKQLADGENGEKFAFVDIDGTRFTMNCMSSLMREVYDGELITFYLTSTPCIFESVNMKYYHFYALKKALVGHVMELLARAPHGQTLGYEERDGKYVPVLENLPSKIFEDWQFDKYIEGIEAFTAQMCGYEKQFSTVSFENQQTMEKYIHFMARDVDRDTANLLGTMVHSLYGKEQKEFAPKVGFAAALKYIITKKIATENILYSKVRSNIIIQKMIDYRLAHPDIRKEMINLFIHKRRRQAYLTILGITIDFGNILFRKKNV